MPRTTIVLGLTAVTAKKKNTLLQIQMYKFYAKVTGA